MSIVERLVHMDCKGCEKRIQRAISKLHGVDSLGFLNKLEEVAEKLSFGHFHTTTNTMPAQLSILDESNFTSSYNYYMHGQNESIHGYFPDLPFPTTIDDRITYSVSEENVHACTIM
ncbi:Heavy metal transport/detoxification superfamily protein [Abeliophyllum distichum]|uniref:Heavy metal transport/detoxification superfamily protein n=1 Tax=Abeliophyllum distichum TaxID=126358 RepID=A0ABD1RQK9_9LAMI